MSINFNPNFNSVFSASLSKAGAVNQPENKNNINKAITGGIKKTNDMQTEANASITDLLSGKNQDINSVVAKVAKADLSFKLLVGVRDKLVDAYKETMKMQI